MTSHVGNKSTDHRVPELKDSFVGGLPWDVTARDGVGCDHIDSNLDAMHLEEVIEMIQSQSLFLCG